MNLDMKELRGGSLFIRDYNMEIYGSENKIFTMKNFVIQTKGNDDTSNGYFNLNLKSFFDPELIFSKRFANDENAISSNINALIAGTSSYTKQSTFVNGKPSELTLFGVTFPEEEKQSVDLVKMIALIVFSTLALITVTIFAIVTIVKKKKKERVMMEEENEDVETSDNINDINAENNDVQNQNQTETHSSRGHRRNSADLEATGRRTRRRANTHHRRSQIPFIPTARATLASEIDSGSSTGRQNTQRVHFDTQPVHQRQNGRNGRTRPRSYSSDDTVPVTFTQPGMPDFAQSPIACPPANNSIISPQNSISMMSPYIQMQPSYNTLRKLDSSTNPFDFAPAPEAENPYKA